MRKKVNPFTHLWFHPVDTVKSVLMERSFWGIFFLAFLGAWATSLFGTMDQKNMVTSSGDLPNSFIIIFAGAVGAIFALIVGSIFTAFFYWLAGKILKGTGSFVALYKGSMFLTFPHFLLFPFVIIYLIAYPANFYNTDLDQTAGSVTLAIIVVILAVICSIYTFIVGIVMLSEVHQFSKWKAFFTMILSVVVISAIIFACVGIFLGLTQL
ncbi:MAG: YIP1 family protein [Kurthia gibsonii]|uniref:YIP1 family protein n=1 Tax=Kurthia gibsonii TaxID=33946 RepID=A0ABU9LHS8_9BACL|nr:MULTISPECIES: YIP1 family protein [Kurthia]AMA63998.1 yip1 domain protein [Kurthia sp. 11kri321]MEB6112568.1 YIP1 family protein [Kurthia gibsonii]WIL37807.1 YIP1 family protein [Kurthia sp. YJT4]HZG13043.1 YIP1 family protein [Kurthia gibsonii]